MIHRCSSTAGACRCSPPHSLQVLLHRRCWQMLDPAHFLHLLLRRKCWQMPAPPHSSNLLLPCKCWQMFDPKHSTHLRLRRWCSPMLRFTVMLAVSCASGSFPCCLLDLLLLPATTRLHLVLRACFSTLVSLQILGSSIACVSKIVQL